jgi:type IV secretory pathway TraG/TraD family ATPase VirD4
MRGGGSTSYSDQRQPLMSPQELMEFPQQEVLVKTRGRRAFRLYKIVAWKDRVFAHRLLEAPPVVLALRLPDNNVNAVADIANALASMMSPGLVLKKNSELSEENNVALDLNDSDAADAELDRELLRVSKKIEGPAIA